ncbi:hypothetical protein Vadar_013167 [Vaccinium darrowii]|uniref:Uncharacterized protein n=1 Tax=Vaccinium darrowii TaxID=229202 RepID=A0ACB7YXA3_9ERIC|nr:hypothetical protein Vadar_013167 [Vaccinium darrowii]
MHRGELSEHSAPEKGIAMAATSLLESTNGGESIHESKSTDEKRRSSYWYEGAVKEDGRGPTIWDVFSHTIGKIADFSNADVAVDQYHLFAEDIQLMKCMGMDAYRFSIAWSRIFPNGTGEINQAGVDHYNNVINALLAEETCFEKFGDRVKHWITFNEPHTFATQGYDTGLFAPGRCSILLHLFCKAGKSATEPYIVGHNILLSHATVADIDRTKYKQKQNGSLGVSFDVIWFEPASNSTEDIEATQRAQDFQFGWFIEPLILGNYPSSMIDRVGSRLPRFTEAESVFSWILIRFSDIIKLVDCSNY